MRTSKQIAVVGEPQVLGGAEIRDGACKGDGFGAGANRHALRAIHFERRKIELEVCRGERVIGVVRRDEHLKADLVVWLLKHN